MSSRRQFLKSLVSIIAAIPIVNTLVKDQSGDWNGTGIPVNKVKKLSIKDALDNGVIRIYSGEMPKHPSEEIKGKEVARLGVRYSKGFSENVKINGTDVLIKS